MFDSTTLQISDVSTFWGIGQPLVWARKHQPLKGVHNNIQVNNNVLIPTHITSSNVRYHSLQWFSVPWLTVANIPQLIHKTKPDTVLLLLNLILTFSLQLTHFINFFVTKDS